VLGVDDVAEMRYLVDRILAGSLTREDWSTLAALLMINEAGRDGCAAIEADGLDAFIRVSQPIYQGHAFAYDDFARIYDRVCAHARI